MTDERKKRSPGFATPVLAVSPDGVRHDFPSLRAFANHLDVTTAAVGIALKKGRKCKGWTFQRKEAASA